MTSPILADVRPPQRTKQSRRDERPISSGIPFEHSPIDQVALDDADNKARPNRGEIDEPPTNPNSPTRYEALKSARYSNKRQGIGKKRKGKKGRGKKRSDPSLVPDSKFIQLFEELRLQEENHDRKETYDAL
ncbi:hypothetical protein BKA56DRAFT_611081 [Ilyonectria sp. MPI-CAGE-AT-0026]|nr:hypothetical protein BKA56DRAFT_611081 [Ilyonectria sp. MPI-CAGE-AT-0026]